MIWMTLGLVMFSPNKLEAEHQQEQEPEQRIEQSGQLWAW